MELVFATYNTNKTKELKYLLSDYDIQLHSLNDYPDIRDINETGSSFTENALIKAEKVHYYLNVPILADDSGLEVDYLNNKPGIYSKRYAGENASDLDRINKLLNELNHIPFHKRIARFVCAMVLKDKRNIFNIIGFCNGIITEKTSGKNGFGYDPVFFLPDVKKTMAQLSIYEKNIISHRANALKQIKEILIQYYKLKKL